MLSEIVRDAVEAQPDMKILHEARTLAELEATPCPRADVIVVAAEKGALPKECTRLMYERPQTGTLSISPDGRLTSLWRMRPHGVTMENVSPDGLVAAIRDLSRPLPSGE
jgi:hypothetical protein